MGTEDADPRSPRKDRVCLCPETGTHGRVVFPTTFGASGSSLHTPGHACTVTVRRHPSGVPKPRSRGSCLGDLKGHSTELSRVPVLQEAQTGHDGSCQKEAQTGHPDEAKRRTGAGLVRNRSCPQQRTLRAGLRAPAGAHAGSPKRRPDSPRPLRIPSGVANVQADEHSMAVRHVWFLGLIKTNIGRCVHLKPNPGVVKDTSSLLGRQASGQRTRSTSCRPRWSPWRGRCPAAWPAAALTADDSV